MYLMEMLAGFLWLIVLLAITYFVMKRMKF